MRTIWKYAVNFRGVTVIELPPAASIRLVAADPVSRMPTLWIEVDSDERRVRRSFVVHATGDAVPNGDQHVGTLIEGAYVWHIFERRGSAA